MTRSEGQLAGGCPEHLSKISITLHQLPCDQARATGLLTKQNNPGRKEPVKPNQCFTPVFWQDRTKGSPREESTVTLSSLLGSQVVRSQPLAQENKLKEPTESFQK